MKRLILMLAMASCMAISNVKAQTVNGVKLSDLKEEYIEVTPARGVYQGIFVDFGQEFSYQTLVVKDDKGKAQKYNSIIAFINKMKPYGYELFQVYVIVSGEDSRPTYVLKRKSE